MQFKMSDNSLFAMLLRSPWWLSFVIALVLGLGGRALLPEGYVFIAPALAFPFVIAGFVALRKQWDLPSEARIEETVDAVAAMSWRDFSSLIEQAFQRDGYVVTRMTGAADFSMLKSGRKVLVCCRRWKAASQGVESLRELVAAREADDEVRELLYVSVAGMSDNALLYAQTNRVNLMLAPQLTRLLRLPKTAGKKKSDDGR